MSAGSVVGIRPPGIKLLVGEIVVKRAVEVVGARACGEVEKTAAGLTELSGVVRGLQRELFQGFY